MRMEEYDTYESRGILSSVLHSAEKEWKGRLWSEDILLEEGGVNVHKKN